MTVGDEDQNYINKATGQAQKTWTKIEAQMVLVQEKITPLPKEERKTKVRNIKICGKT